MGGAAAGAAVAVGAGCWARTGADPAAAAAGADAAACIVERSSLEGLTSIVVGPSLTIPLRLTPCSPPHKFNHLTLLNTHARAESHTHTRTYTHTHSPFCILHVPCDEEIRQRLRITWITI
jgi:hypothetical protein